MAQVIPPLMRICNKTLNSTGKNSTFQTGLKAEEPSERSKVASSQNSPEKEQTSTSFGFIWLTFLTQKTNCSPSTQQECRWGFLPMEKKISALFLQLTTTQLLLTRRNGTRSPHGLFSGLGTREQNASKHRPANSWGCFTGFIVITFFHKALATINLLFIAWGSQFCLAHWFS